MGLSTPKKSTKKSLEIWDQMVFASISLLKIYPGPNETNSKFGVPENDGRACTPKKEAGEHLPTNHFQVLLLMVQKSQGQPLLGCF